MAIQTKKKTKRELDALETRSKVFKTAIKLFAKYGFDAVTIDDITKRAGVSKGTFYTYFSSKESVLVEQFHLIDKRYEEAFGLLDENASAGEQLHLLVDTMTNYCSTVCGLNFMKVVYMNQISLGKKENILREDSNRPVFEILRNIVETGKRTGEFKTNLSSEQMIDYIARFVRSLIYDWCLYDGERDLEEMGREYFDVIIKWLRTA